MVASSIIRRSTVAAATIAAATTRAESITAAAIAADNHATRTAIAGTAAIDAATPSVSATSKSKLLRWSRRYPDRQPAPIHRQPRRVHGPMRHNGRLPGRGRTQLTSAPGQ